MLVNALNGLVFGLVLMVTGVSRVRSQGVNLGQLHWCDTMCLCHDDTNEKMKCFTEEEIYTLVEVEMVKVGRMSRAGFVLEEKLKWCSETCLCHKAGHKEFRCTDNVKLGTFIDEKAPFLSPFLELVEEADGDEAEQEVKKDRQGRRRGKKHRRNRKKPHHDKEAPTTEAPPQEMEEEAEILPATSPAPPPGMGATEPGNAVVHGANILPQASTGRGIPSRSPDEAGGQQAPELEVPRERKTVAGEVSNGLEELRLNMAQIKGDVELNMYILLVTVAVAAVAMIGVLILAIYSCCLRRSSKGSRGASLRREENNTTKVNLDEAW